MSLATKLWLLLTTVLIGFSTQAQDFTRAILGPSIAEIRTKAEAGDPEAQCKLADAYSMHYDARTNAIYWYRKAAKQGYADGQYGLARMLPQPESEKWFLLAANQNQINAQHAMADICEHRRKDKIEAGKWLILAVKQRPYERPCLDELTLKMTSAQVIEAQKRAAAFLPTKPTRIDPELKLQSIIGTGNNRLALINGHTFKAGEQAQLKIDDETVTTKCIEIGTRTAIVENNGTQKVLSLP